MNIVCRESQSVFGADGTPFDGNRQDLLTTLTESQNGVMFFRMRVLRPKSPDLNLQLAELTAPSSLLDPQIEARTREIVDDVRARGDAAVLELTRRFDQVSLTVEQLQVTTSELMQASLSAGEDLRASIADAHANIAEFARSSLRHDWHIKNSHGAKVGEKFNAFHRVGIYIPGGTAPLISTALMTITLAQIAGCPEIVVCSPSNAAGTLNPALVYAARFAGATEIYKVGGAQAIAAMAYGTDTIQPVSKIFGPGNAYVVAAKRLVYGQVAVDLLPGPSEVCILADETAEAAWVAADLVAQAEHGSGHERVWLVTTSSRLLAAVEKEVKKQVQERSRREQVEAALANNGWLIQVKRMDEAIALVNRLAPEHCEIMTDNPRRVSREITTAGAIFIGGYSPTVVGDYVAGPSHTLPTGGAARSFGGLTVDQFQRRTSVVEYSKSALKKASKSVGKFAEVEGLDAHGFSSTVRRTG